MKTLRIDTTCLPLGYLNKAINMIVYTPHLNMIFDKLHITLKQHVKEGIALPLNTVSRLDRLVTVRY